MISRPFFGQLWQPVLSIFVSGWLFLRRLHPAGWAALALAAFFGMLSFPPDKAGVGQQVISAEGNAAGQALSDHSEEPILEKRRPDEKDVAIANSVSGEGEGKAAAPVRWTAEPVRVDRAAQQLERLDPRPVKENPYPMVLRVSPSVRMLDSATFRLNDVTYSVAHIEPVAATHICLDPQGRRWACGVRARVAVRNMIVGRVLQCRAESADLSSATLVVDCMLSGTGSLATAITAKGWGLPTKKAPDPITLARFNAERARAGIFAPSVPGRF